MKMKYSFIVPLELEGAKLPLVPLELEGAKLPLYKVAVQHRLTPRGRYVIVYNMSGKIFQAMR